MNKVPQIFKNVIINEARLKEINKQHEPRSRYIIAMTPRSGSSYLCDVMTKVKRFGSPDEVINQEFIPNILTRFPSRTPEEYIKNIICCRKTKNGLSGFKASWFQFSNFIQTMDDHSYLKGFKYIYLIRRDVSAQAVSLYKATETNVFHTNKQPTAESIDKLQQLEYNYHRINEWYEHIKKQEKGWQNYFFKNRIFPLCITYEDIEEDILSVMKRIALYVDVLPKNVSLPEEESVFQKTRNSCNMEWTQRFLSEHCSK